MYLTEAVSHHDLLQHSVKITRDRLGRFFLIFMTSTPWDELPKQKPVDERSVVALDPGVRTFQTFYSPDRVGKYCSGQSGFVVTYNDGTRTTTREFASTHEIASALVMDKPDRRNASDDVLKKWDDVLARISYVADPNKRTKFLQTERAMVDANNPNRTIPQGGKVSITRRSFNKVFAMAEKCDATIGRLADDSLSNLERKKLLRTKHLLIERQKNMVTELHRKVALDLCKNYDTILIPTFETSNMTKKKDPKKATRRKINSKTARSMLTLRHYNFRTFLQHKAVMMGCEAITVDEHYTSKTCGACGCINDNLGGSETFTCPSCGFRCDRDEHAGRNIFIKHLRGD